MVYHVTEQRNRRIVIVLSVLISVFVSGTLILATEAITESNYSYKTYNYTYIHVSGYDALKEPCFICNEYFHHNTANNATFPLLTAQKVCVNFDYRGYIMMEYYANNTLYKYTASTINDKILCGLTKQDAIHLAQTVWPPTTIKSSYYLISDPTKLFPVVMHGEIFIVATCICGGFLIASIIAIVIYVYKRNVLLERDPVYEIIS